MLNKFSHPNQSSKNDNLLNIHRVVIIQGAIFWKLNKTDDQDHKLITRSTQA